MFGVMGIGTSAGASVDTPRTRVMFVVACAFLVVLALVLPHGGLAEVTSDWLMQRPAVWFTLGLLWLIVIAEGIAGFLVAPDRAGKARLRLLLVALVPPMRMTISPARPADRIWLPGLGTLVVGKAALAKMEQRFALPMLVMTALIVPVIAADFLTAPKLHDTLALEMEDVEAYARAEGGDRLFMLDGTGRTVFNISRRDGGGEAGDLTGRWTVVGNRSGPPPTVLTFESEGSFRMVSGCAVSEGMASLAGPRLAFSGLERVSRCAPTFLEATIWFVTALIWFSFALEFILLVSLAEKKIEFCKKNWINIVIILLPLLAFLRSLQLFRFLRMAKAGRLMRVYRLRGLVTRVAKLATLFNLIERLLSRNPDKYGSHLREKIADKEEELADLKSRLAACEDSLKRED